MKKYAFLSLLLTLCLLLTACASGPAAPEDTGGAADTPSQNQSQTGGEDTGLTAQSDMFTDRDLRTTYDGTAAAFITLTGSGADCASDAVSVSGSTVTVLDEGTYILTGSLTGQLVVDAPEDAKTQLVLRDVTVHSETSAALYIRQADKVVVTLEGENALSCGESFTAVDENNIDGAVFSKSDLTFNGAGSLTVTSPAGHGIVGKDDLVFAGGSYTVTSAAHGAAANDSIRCVGAAMTVDAGKDALHAEKGDETAPAFVYMESGTYSLEAEGDGISAEGALTVAGGSYTLLCGGGSENGEKQSSDNWGGFGGGMMPGGPGAPGGMGGSRGPGGVSFQTTTADTAEDSTSMKGLKAGTELTVTGGTFTVDSADDGFHSNGSLTVLGGTFTVATGDDGFHAEETLTVTGGTVTVTESYEGLEGLHVAISGGEIRISADDDGINAAGGTDGSGTGGRDQFGGMGGMGSGSGSIVISGGEIHVKASGDGLDANGTLEISGGFTVVCGPTQGDTAVLDYDRSAVITGGTFIGTGSTMMAQTFSQGSTQGVFAVTCGSQQAGTRILLQDDGGSTVVDYTPELSFGLVILSTPEMVPGAEYTVTVGTASGTFAAG